MTSIFNILIIIIVLFFMLLIIKEFIYKSKEKFCVICLSVTLTWLSLLFLYWFNLFQDKIILALLMGQTILGVFYLVEKKVNKEIKIFRLPFILTLITIGYLSLTLPNDITKTIILLFTIWLIFLILYFYRSNQNLKLFVKKIIECCRRV